MSHECQSPATAGEIGCRSCHQLWAELQEVRRLSAGREPVTLPVAGLNAYATLEQMLHAAEAQSRRPGRGAGRPDAGVLPVAAQPKLGPV